MSTENVEEFIDSLMGDRDVFFRSDVYAMLKESMRWVKRKSRHLQYYSKKDKIISYSSASSENRCTCGGTCYHKEYDYISGTMYFVCNSCDRDIAISKNPEIDLAVGDWK